MELLKHCLLHAWQDTWMMFPFLLITYLILETIERKGNIQDDRIFLALHKYGPLVGAVVGLIPQCGFSILAAMLFLQRNITLGTLLAVFIATSDEAIPILISNPQMITTLGVLLVCKFVLAVLVGYFTDKVLFRHQKIAFLQESDEAGEEDEGFDSSCPCCYPQYPLALSALLRSIKIYLFIFVTSFVLTGLIEYFGEESLGNLLLAQSALQPVLASVIGLIPNCAATVVLSQLYMTGELQFGSLLAGLITNTGLGYLVLVRYKENKQNILFIFVTLMAVAIVCGILCTLFAI